MNNNNVTPNSPNLAAMQNNSGNELTIKDLWYLCLDNWKWFALSIVFCLACAAAYLLTTPKSYTRSASILIKEERNGKNINRDMAQAFGDLGISAARSNVYNELKMMQSKDLARDVVKRLALNINYMADGTFHGITLYGKTLPVKTEFVNIEDNAFVSFDIDFPGKSDEMKLYNFKKNGKAMDGTVSTRPGYNVTNTPVGKMVILKTADYAQAEKRTIHVSRIGIDNARDAVLHKFSANINDKNATLIDLSYIDVSPQRAEDVLNTFIAIYNENWIKDKNEITLSTSEFIRDRLEVIEKELGNVDNSISSYKTEHQITNLDVSSNMYLQKTNEADAKILALNNQLFMAKNIRTYLLNANNTYQLLPVNSGINNATIESQIKDFNARVLQRNNIVANSSEKSPIAIDIEKQLENLRTSIISGIDNEISAIQTQINSERTYAGEANQKITSSPGQQKYLLSVERQQKVKESLYLYLLQKREENELSQAFTAYNTRIVDAPQGSSRPTAPVSRNIILMALLAGLCIPFGILYLRETMNTTVRDRKDIEKRLTMPFLGEIPIYINNVPKRKYEFWKKAKKEQQMVVREGSRGVINEAFRIIGTNLEFMAGNNKDNKKNVYMVTSYNAGSGKSFIMANIGATYAIKRKHVLVIDGDLRHATVSKLVNSPKLGISDYLSGKETDINKLIVTTPQFSNYDVLPVGTIPPNPTELLSSPQFAELIDMMKERYDYVFIDCPPADMMADATIIGQHADRTIFVIRAELFERSMLNNLENDFKNDKFNNMALILNGTSIQTGRYGNKYGYGKYGKYGYGYGGYGYGYGSKEEE